MPGKIVILQRKVYFEIDINMAKPIKETPILTGSDAEHFAYSVEHPRAVTKEEVERALAVYEKLSKCSELV